MTGIRERRMWPAGPAIRRQCGGGQGRVWRNPTCERSTVELFIHAAVSRDMLEPATASFAHRKIGLPASAQIFDVSNACLGFLNSLTLAGG